MSELKKMWKDLLKTPGGKYSRKSINWLIGTVMFIIEVFFHLITGITIQESILYITVGYSGFMAWLTMKDKSENKNINYNNNDDDNENVG